MGIVIVCEDLMGNIRADISFMFDYKFMVDNDFMYNILLCFMWYVFGFVFVKFFKDGGFKVME